MANQISKADYSALMLSLPKEEQKTAGVQIYKGFYIDSEDAKAFQSESEVDEYITETLKSSKLF